MSTEAISHGPAHASPQRRRARGGFARAIWGGIGVIAELMITAGVVLLLFVVWQLWWTDVGASRTQADAVASLGWTDPSGWTPGITAADDEAAGVAIAQPQAGDPPVITTPLAEAEVFATMYIPRFGADYEKPIAEGISRPLVLDKLGIGHYPDTQLPGELGNFAVAAHRNTYGKPFHQIAELQLGDAVVVRTADYWYVYTVTAAVVVNPHQVGVLSPVPADDQSVIVAPTEPLTTRYLTMTSCHPIFSARERYVVHGELAYWAKVADGVPQELLDQPA